mmetsp:Transcript_53835/g.128247  ORF Transcript_53835/g.128247 Transcript_53835/m.128247 type:complete len:80 (-) Transcript_53835:8-247(-)
MPAQHLQVSVRMTSGWSSSQACMFLQDLSEAVPIQKPLQILAVSTSSEMQDVLSLHHHSHTQMFLELSEHAEGAIPDSA